MFYGRLTFCRKTARMYAKPCEQLLIADNLSKAGWSWGCDFLSGIPGRSHDRDDAGLHVYGPRLA
jgi:hypothetical protein